jgi:hypothetical protein
MVGKPLDRVQKLDRRGLEQLKMLLTSYVHSNHPEDEKLNAQSLYVQEHISATLNVKLYNEDPEARAAGE